MPMQPSPKADTVSPSFPKVRFFILFPFVHRFGWPDAPGRWATLTPALSHRMGEGEASRTAAPRSAHGDERDLRVALIAHDARGVRVERWRAIHQELVLVMAVGQWDLEEPPAIRSLLHRIGRRVPIIEIPDQQNRFCLRCEAKEIDRLGHVPLLRRAYGGREAVCPPKGPPVLWSVGAWERGAWSVERWFDAATL